jgi:crotonobetainyl-CoA:carnitine CoA-transferase CaiB-like acyl-CoA transferase
MTPGPLCGIKVLDFTTSLSGPLGAVILADLGADVIKVERTGAADRARITGTTCGDISAMFHMGNRGKRAIELDLRLADELDVAIDLAREADLVIENFRPGVTTRLGIDFASLSAVNPNLIYVSLTGFGASGPYALRPAFDSIIQAYGGVAAVQGRADPQGIPTLVNHAIVDKVAGMMAAQGALTALLARDRGAGGQYVEVSMLDVAAWFIWLDAAGSSTLTDAPAGQPQDATTGKRIQVRYADGWGMLSLGHDDSFRSICGVFGVDVSGYPHLLTAPGRDRHSADYEEVIERIRAAAATMTRAEAGQRLGAAGSIFGEVLDVAELPANEQLSARGLFVESAHPAAGRIVEPKLPIVFSATPPPPPRPSPGVNEHGDEIRAEVRLRQAAGG